MTVDSNGIVLKHTLFGDDDIIVKILRAKYLIQCYSSKIDKKLKFKAW